MRQFANNASQLLASSWPGEPLSTLLTKFVKFTGVGAIGTLVHYGILILLVQSISLDAVLASTAGFLAGAFTNYLLNYHYTFSSNKLHRETITKFFAVSLAGMLLNAMIMSVCTDMFDLHYLLAQILATGLVLIWNFSANHAWTFRENELWTKDTRD